jgi:hypothetical protein
VTTPPLIPAFVGQARWQRWHPVLWGGMAPYVVATLVVVVLVDRWAEAQPLYVEHGRTTWWGLIALPIVIVAVWVAAVWTPGRPSTAQHVLWRAACNCFVVGGLGLIAALVAPLAADGGGRIGGMLLTAFMTAGLGFACFGLLLLVAAATIDAQRRKGHLLRPWDLAVLPGLAFAIVALGIFGALAAIEPDENYRRRREAMMDVLLTMVGVHEPARAAWLIPTWIAFVLLIVCVVHARRLAKRVPDL